VPHDTIGLVIGGHRRGTAHITATLLTNQSDTTTVDVRHVPSQIVSHWRGDGDATDAADGNDGTLFGGMGFAPGLDGQGFALDGIDDYMNVGNAPNLQLSGGTFSVSAWVLVNGAGTDMSVLDKMNPAGVNTDGWRLFRQVDNRYWFCLGGGAANGCTPGGETTVRAAPITTGVWYHVVGVKSADSIAIYLNGVLQEQKPLPSFTDTHAADLLIGRNELEGSFLDGLIDDARVYSGVLTANEVDSLFDAIVSPGPSKMDITVEPVGTDDDAVIDSNRGHALVCEGRQGDQICASSEALLFQRVVLGGDATGARRRRRLTKTMSLLTGRCQHRAYSHRPYRMAIRQRCI
jgi:hypothetical protein